MSGNRSVQSAQRRRAGGPEPGIPGRGPQPSINSSQIFSGNQVRPPSAQNMSKQQQQQMANNQASNKMTIPQAITLITLRLGSLESKMINLEQMNFSQENNTNENGEKLNMSLIEDIMTRIELLEKRPTTVQPSNSVAPPVNSSELTLLKQQVDALKNAFMQVKSSSNNITKENAELKSQIERLQNEIVETKQLLNELQNITMDNSQKILNISLGNYEEFNGEFNGELDEEIVSNINNGVTELTNLENNELLEPNIKEILNNELNFEVEENI